jgi:hypothetical protein
MIVLALSYFLGKDKKWIPKEISMVKMTLDRGENVLKSQSYLFQPPYSDRSLPPEVKKTNAWIERHRAHSKWDDGNVMFTLWEDLLFEFCSRETEIYAKGSEQVKFFSDALPGQIVQDLDKMGCPKAEDIAYEEGGGMVTCGVARHGEYCPLNRCMQYLFWLEDRQQQRQQQQQQQQQRWGSSSSSSSSSTVY